MSLTKEALTSASVIAWLLDNSFVTESGALYELVKHRFMIDYLNDDHPHKATKKSSQVGLTVAEFLDDFHLVGKRGMDVIHTFHTSDILQSVVRPKVNPLIQNNPAIREMVTVDSEGLKGLGNHFLYIRGANAESQAISISADVLKVDEKDRSNLNVVEMFGSRLDFSPYKWIREFSNPSAVGMGVDATYSKSDQRHWFVTCHWCNHASYIDWEQDPDIDPAPHYVDVDREVFACGKCGQELTNADRIRGEWVSKYQSRDRIHGYWFSQMMAPWFTAADIIRKYEDNSVEFFYNFVLGKAYTQADLKFTRETILAACRPGRPAYRDVVLGSDIGKPHWYWLGTPAGVFEVGRAESWDELERIFLQYKCVAWVMDALPEFTQVQKMVRKYPGKAFGCEFRKTVKGTSVIEWGQGPDRGRVFAKRTPAIDRLVTEVANLDLRFLCQPDRLEDLIKHAENMYRVIETDELGTTKVEWHTQGEETSKKPDHLVLTGVYWRIALEKAFSGSGYVDESAEGQQKTIAPTLREGKIEVKFDLERSIQEARRIRP